MDKKAKAPVEPKDAPDVPGIVDARQRGLRYRGTATHLQPPAPARQIPARHLTPDETAYYVPDRVTLRWLLAHGFSLADPPPEKETDHAD